MAETDNIARMAGKVSDDIFEVFGWTRQGPVNQNWECVANSHLKRTHPSDVVFWYDDPYRPLRVFWNVDLKSYAASTVSKANVAGAISSLVVSVDCANVSGGWHKLYGDEENNWRCDGLLFVYNHDNTFDVDFRRMLDGVDPSNLQLSAKRRLVVLGPPDILYLANVAHDIVSMRGKGRLPRDANGIQYWYPDLVRPKRREQAKSAATIEMLTGPWVTIHVRPEHHDGKRAFLVYYREKGDTVDEFKYLLDSFFRFQMLSVDSEAEIDVRLVDADAAAAANFAKAKEQVSTSLYGLANARLQRVRCDSISTIVRRFSEIELGMENR